MADSSDSEDDGLGAFAFLGKAHVVDSDSSDDDVAPEAAALRYPLALDEVFMSRDADAVKTLFSVSAESAEDGETETALCEEEKASLGLAQGILEGRHLEALRDAPSEFQLLKLLEMCHAEDDLPTAIRRDVHAYLCGGNTSSSSSSSSAQLSAESRMQQVLLLGTAWLEVYCQENYTGPELNPAELTVVHGEPTAAGGSEKLSSDDEEALRAVLHSKCLQHLECDGVYAFGLCAVPHALLFARCLLRAVALPSRAPWKAGVSISKDSAAALAMASAGVDSDGNGNGTGGPASLLMAMNHNDRVPVPVTRAAGFSRAASWLSARAAMTHARAMHHVSTETLPSLWLEVQDSFAAAEAAYKIHSYCPEGSSGETEVDFLLITQLWLERGLSWHHFNHRDQGKEAFAQAKRAAGLQTILTGAMGKRTKHQKKDYAQMLLMAQSAFLHGSRGRYDAPQLVDPNQNTVADESNIIKGGGIGGLDLEDVDASGMPRLPPKPRARGSGSGSEDLSIRRVVDNEVLDGEQEQGWQHGEFETGKRLVREAADGSEAAVREVMLDSVDGGAQENILLEGGPKYTDDVDKEVQLHPVDQAVVLGLCLDVGNSNADDDGGLTREEKFPYLQRVLNEAKSWMIHSTGLLERSWLEFEKGRTADRAMLQMQALLDQHTTKLTAMQSTFKSVTEESAPVQERMMYLHCIAYPAQYELKRDLARRYLKCQVINSALNYFRELEMWDEVVACYQLMDKPHRAELVVRERLKVARTPYMVCALADLTIDEALYEQAWELSEHRFARAKRTLGKICFDKGKFAAAVGHLTQALEISPMVPTSWYLKGLASMRMEDWTTALESFSICVQQDMELGEAWANSGSIYMHLNENAKALMAFEQALKYKRGSWRLLENMMSVSLKLNKFQECIGYKINLLDMREKSDRPVHKEELRRLCFMTAAINRKTVRDSRSAQSKDSTNDSDNQMKIDMKALLDDDDQDLIIIGDEDLDRNCFAVERLLERITSTISADAEIWDIFADFEISLGRLQHVLNCRVRQFRSLLNAPNWEKHEERIEVVLRSARALTAIHFTKIITRSDLYSCSSLLSTALRKVAGLFQDSDHHLEMKTLADRINKHYEKTPKDV